MYVTNFGHYVSYSALKFLSKIGTRVILMTNGFKIHSDKLRLMHAVEGGEI